MKILVLLQSYPTQENPYAQMWAHSRNREYVAQGCDVDVLSFSAKESYELEGVRVKDLGSFDCANSYDLIVSHQPNLRSHIRFLLRFYRNVPIVFFIHGHEVMVDRWDYSTPYSYIKKNYLVELGRLLYDLFKIQVLKRFFLFNRDRIGIVFVSDWMKATFEKRLRLDVEDLFSSAIIPNSVGKDFLTSSYNWCSPKIRDFITIRQLDWSKHCVDKVVELAHANPQYSFTLYGQGSYFDHFEKPANLHWISRFLQPSEIPAVLDEHKCALMPSRVDSQGVMMCEMATFGIPVITSDIDVCKEMLQEFQNCKTMNLNEFNKKIDLAWVDSELSPNKSVFDSKVLVPKELGFFNSFLRNKRGL